ncbi:hypothetical protein A6J40_01730 [Legionella longbeachae]|uniref:hypothetical protein n=1 Tax=Legionella longbeachae TaxID=450 RepID=UPI0009B71B20|nr:hypothetical protein [Legionella longbeachae]VEE02762.1 Uncharacterised protein [Legionella oakridgensis]ARB90989.1 hypothetical protein A6J40_01730 [Legionella longbeachae]ARM32585.1 hypothetical protein B0B39_03190 [Legionella longbeachae]RZV21069.1 hypothetical protein EKG34_17545 [Legionella longbeachae]UAK45811.1 hypothetical protein K8O86_13635 [Legionella longbeachae]
MKWNLTFFCTLILLAPSLVYAEKILLPPPGGQPSSCEEAYRNASNTLTLESVKSSLSNICKSQGGWQVMYKIVTLAPPYPPGVVLSCVKNDNGNISVLYSCRYGTSSSDL